MTTKRTDILLATRDLVFEQGLQSVAMSQISQRGGVGMGTIYNYFANKETLVNALFAQLAQDHSDAGQLNLNTTADVKEQFIQIGVNLLTFGISDTRNTIVYDQLSNSPYIQREVRMKDYGLDGTLYRLLVDAKRHNHIKNLPFDLLAHIYYGCINGALRAHIAGKTMLSPQLIQQSALVSWDSIKR